MNDCCKVSENLVEWTGTETDRKVFICQVCQRRHIRFRAEPGRIGIRKP